MSVSAIEKRQNENRILQYQYAARSYYNRAEKLNMFVWIFCFVSWVAVFLPASSSAGVFFIAIPFLADIIAFITNCRMMANIRKASSLRKYFDAYVFDLNIDQFTQFEVQNLHELSMKAVKNHPKESKIQMANTGRDNPPGVRDWYEIPSDFSEQDTIFECQKQNCWWNRKITCKRVVCTGIALLILIAVAVVFFLFVNKNVMLIILSSGGVIIKGLERLVANAKYYRLSSKIDDTVEALTVDRSGELLKYLQGRIDERRAMPVLEINIVHRMLAGKLSVLYKRISTRSIE